MQLFDLVKFIFSNNKKKWEEIGSYDKAKNFFMVNRIMSTQFPLQANQFNKIKIVPQHVIDWWHDSLSNVFSKPPVWIYTKTRKKDPVEKESSKNYEDTERFIRDRYQLSIRDLEQLKKFYPDKYNKWVKEVSEQLGIKS
jgi:hypothetical protein